MMDCCYLQAVVLSEHGSRYAPARHDNIRVKSTHPSLSRHRVWKTPWACYPTTRFQCLDMNGKEQNSPHSWWLKWLLSILSLTLPGQLSAGANYPPHAWTALGALQGEVARQALQAAPHVLRQQQQHEQRSTRTCCLLPVYCYCALWSQIRSSWLADESDLSWHRFWGRKKHIFMPQTLRPS